MKRYVCGLSNSLLAGLFLWFAAGSAVAMQQPQEGPVLVTVAGKIEKTNRGPFDPFEDGLTKAHDITFERAFAFDKGMLEKLGMNSLTVRYPDWPKAYRFEGPLLSDVLKAAGAEGKSVRAVALDGYSASITAQDLREFDILLAIKKDGSYLPVGGRGPAWVVFPRDSHEALQARDESQWVWSVYMIVVE